MNWTCFSPITVGRCLLIFTYSDARDALKCVCFVVIISASTLLCMYLQNEYADECEISRSMTSWKLWSAHVPTVPVEWSKSVMYIVDLDNPRHALKSTLRWERHTRIAHSLFTDTHTSGMRCFHSPDLDCQSEELGCAAAAPSKQHRFHPYHLHTHKHTHTLPLCVRFISI